MSDNEYLWNKTGEPDPELQRLETLLGELRHHQPLRAVEPRRATTWIPAVAAALVVIGFAGWLVTRGPKVGWNLEIVSEGRVESGRTLAVGDTLETTSTSHARIALPDFAEVEVGPNSRLRLLDSKKGRAHLALDIGLIHAFVTAPPGNFSVATPSATAVDLGCEYTLQVDPNGNGLVRVDSGWVSFEWQRREVFIPAGAACPTSRGRGPGIPYFEDSSPEFRAALASFESDLPKVLAAARKEDAFTLWHLLPRVDAANRGAVFERLTTLGFHADRDAILRLDGHAMDALWDSLGLDDTAEWRRWKRPWQPQ